LNLKKGNRKERTRGEKSKDVRERKGGPPPKREGSQTNKERKQGSGGKLERGKDRRV